MAEKKPKKDVKQPSSYKELSTRRDALEKKKQDFFDKNDIESVVEIGKQLEVVNKLIEKRNKLNRETIYDSKEYDDVLKSIGGKFYTKTINPALGIYRNNHTDNWKPTLFNGKVRHDNNEHSDVYKTIKVRASYCHEYSGETIEGYDELLKPIGELRLGNRVDTEKVNQFFSF